MVNPRHLQEVVMSRPNRNEQFPPGVVSFVHCVQRCVRRAFLCGKDPLSGKSYDHRREWIRGRLEQLAAVFGVDVLGYAVMMNHFHVQLRSRPDIVELWTDEEVLIRWHRLCPGYRLFGLAPSPSPEELERLKQTGADKIAELRKRLSNISWFMKELSEPIARAANAEDGCTGCFWEGRFKCHKNLDICAILCCQLYLDLNPIRAGIAATPEESHYTSARDRILAAQGIRMSSASLPGGEPVPRDAWLSPLLLTGNPPSDPQISNSGVRASDKGFLEMGLDRYLQLLDWVGRQTHPEKAGKTPEEIEPILERLGIPADHWCEYVHRFGKIFRRAAGNPAAMQQDAELNGHKWAVGVGKARSFYKTSAA